MRTRHLAALALTLGIAAAVPPSATAIEEPCTEDAPCYPWWGVEGYGNAEFKPRPEISGDELTALFTGPTPSLHSAPPDSTTVRDATFSFKTVLTSPLRFECRLDEGEWTACAPQGSRYAQTRYFGLADGVHRFAVRSVDESGDPDPTPAEFSWRVDNLPPETTLNPVPIGNPPHTWRFKPGSSDPGIGRFFSAMDDEPFGFSGSMTYWSHMDSTMFGSDYGHHRFTFAAMDAAGNVDPTPVTFEYDTFDPLAPPTPAASQAPTPVPAPMRLELAMGKASTRALARRRAIPVDVLAPVSGRLRVRLTGSGKRRLGARAIKLERIGRSRVAVRLAPKTQAWLRKHRRMRVTAVGTLAPAGGGQTLRATSKALIGAR